MPHDAPLSLRTPAAPTIGPTVARAVGDAALALTWRVVQAHSRERFLSAVPSPLSRLYYTADDGWQAPLFVLPARAGTTGEPVLLAHGLGGSALDFDLGATSLARALSDDGYTVYLFEHRADRSALPPPNAAPFTADDLATRDLDAALVAVQQHGGFPRVMLVGHGFGAQVLLLRAGLLGQDDIAGTVLIAGAVKFSEAASSTRTLSQIASILPASWVLPTRRFQQLAAPFIATGAELGSPGTEGSLARAHLRHAAGDLHVGVLRQVSTWFSAGHLTDATGRFDIVQALRPCAALVIEPDNDPGCPRGAAEPAATQMGAYFERLSGGWGHLDPLLGSRAPKEVHPRVRNFLAAARRKCW